MRATRPHVFRYESGEGIHLRPSSGKCLTGSARSRFRLLYGGEGNRSCEILPAWSEVFATEVASGLASWTGSFVARLRAPIGGGWRSFDHNRSRVVDRNDVADCSAGLSEPSTQISLAVHDALLTQDLCASHARAGAHAGTSAICIASAGTCSSSGPGSVRRCSSSLSP